MRKNTDIRKLALMGMLTALIVVLTPLSLTVGPLAITFNVIPVAIAAITFGPVGGAAIGAVFGICSFLQCMGILGSSGMGIFTFEISPLLTFLQRFIPRVMEGFFAGCIFRLSTKLVREKVSCFVAGFFTAFLNTIFFMSALVIFFGNNEGFNETYMKGKSAFMYIIGAISLNAIVEAILCTIVAGAVGFALYRAKLISIPKKKTEVQ